MPHFGLILFPGKEIEITEGLQKLRPVDPFDQANVERTCLLQPALSAS